MRLKGPLAQGPSRYLLSEKHQRERSRASAMQAGKRDAASASESIGQRQAGVHAPLERRPFRLVLTESRFCQRLIAWARSAAASTVFPVCRALRPALMGINDTADRT